MRAGAGPPINRSVRPYRSWITAVVLLGALGALSLSAVEQRREIAPPAHKQRPISLRVSDTVEYCIVDARTNKAFGYVTDGFGNVKQVPCPYLVNLPVLP